MNGLCRICFAVGRIGFAVGRIGFAVGRIGFAVGRIGFAAGCMLTTSGAALAAPAYIKAAPAELTEAYGEDVAKRAFSDELTQTRTELINESVKLVAPGECPEEPEFTLTDAYPYQS